MKKLATGVVLLSAAMAGCGDIHIVRENRSGSDARDEPALVTGPAPVYSAGQTVQSPTTGHWEWRSAPDGRQARLFVPDNSYPMPQLGPPPRDELYTASRGRFDTIRLPDGRLDAQWHPDQPSTPGQGYFQVMPDNQRMWVPAVVSTAGNR